MWFLFNTHGSLNSFSFGDTIETGLDLLFYYSKVLIPGRYYLTRVMWRLWKAFLITKLVKGSVALGQQRVLHHDLVCKEMGEYGKGSRDDWWEA